MVKFRLAKIETQQFAAFPEVTIQKSEINIRTGLHFYADKEKKVVGVAPHFTYASGEEIFLTIQVAIFAEIEAKDWAEHVHSDDGHLTIPKELARHLLVLAVGATRGILHEKTQGTKHNQFILPTIDVTGLVQEDLVLEMQDEEE